MSDGWKTTHIVQHEFRATVGVGEDAVSLISYPGESNDYLELCAMSTTQLTKTEARDLAQHLIAWADGPP